MSVKISMIRAVDEIMFHLPHFRFLLLQRYQYQFEPDQLIQICMFAESCGPVEGAFLEIGCAEGATTVLLNKYLKRRGIYKQYIAIDTFHGFEAEDIRCERDRGKDMVTLPLEEEFRNSKKKYFDASVQLHGISNVKSIQCDATKFLYNFPIAFCLLDVDLYRPTRLILPNIFRQLSRGGIIVVDDCSDGGGDASAVRWDGSLQAYTEFVAEIGQKREIVCDKLGIIRNWTIRHSPDDQHRLEP